MNQAASGGKTYWQSRITAAGYRMLPSDYDWFARLWVFGGGLTCAVLNHRNGQSWLVGLVGGALLGPVLVLRLLLDATARADRKVSRPPVPRSKSPLLSWPPGEDQEAT